VPPAAARPQPKPAPQADPPTRRLSLADELFGGDEDDDETIHLPRVTDRSDDR
jgi:hypothetical protein